jgi:beta-lactamase regulating signal transducer with metallopeptidase domain
MTLLLVKVTLILLMALAVTACMRRARASSRHLVLCAALVGAAFVPLADALIGPVNVPVLPRGSATHVRQDAPAPAPRGAVGAAPPAPAAAGAPEPGRANRVPLALLALWGAGAVALLVRLTGSTRQLRRIRRHGAASRALSAHVAGMAAARGVRRPVIVVEHAAVPSPLTWGWRRPVVALPLAARGWSGADREAALAHELEHVSRGDWLIERLAHLVAIAWWWHPLAWTTLRRLRMEADRACDDAVIATHDVPAYAALLVSVARATSTASAFACPGMSHPSGLRARVQAVLDAQVPRGPATSPARAGALAFALLALALSPLRAVEARVEAAESATTDRDGGQRQPRGFDDGPGAALLHAARRGDFAAMTALIERGVPVNAVVPGDGSPLIGAALGGHVEAVRLLLDHGADPALAVAGDANPLIAASAHGHLEAAALLLDRGARVDDVVPDDDTALIHAAGGGHLSVVELLVSRGADVNLGTWAEPQPWRPDGAWRTPLRMAEAGGHREVADFLRAHGAAR